MHLLLYAYKEGEEGHKLVIQVMVVGSAKVTPGHIAKHCELEVLTE